MAVDYDGRILAQADPGPGEKIVVAPIDIAALRYEKKRRAGHQPLAHLRSEMYPVYERSYFPQGSFTKERDHTVDMNQKNIDNARRKIEESSL